MAKRDRRKAGGYDWNAYITQGEQGIEQVRTALERLANDRPGSNTQTFALLLLRAANGLTNIQAAFWELERIGNAEKDRRAEEQLSDIGA